MLSNSFRIFAWIILVCVHFYWGICSYQLRAVRTLDTALHLLIHWMHQRVKLWTLLKSVWNKNQVRIRTPAAFSTAYISLLCHMVTMSTQLYRLAGNTTWSFYSKRVFTHRLFNSHKLFCLKLTFTHNEMILRSCRQLCLHSDQLTTAVTELSR